MEPGALGFAIGIGGTFLILLCVCIYDKEQAKRKIQKIQKIVVEAPIFQYIQKPHSHVNMILPK